MRPRSPEKSGFKRKGGGKKRFLSWEGDVQRGSVSVGFVFVSASWAHLKGPTEDKPLE